LFDIRPVLFVNGILLLILAAAMGLPVAVDLATDHTEWQAFLASSMVGAFIGLALTFSSFTEMRPELRTREAFLLTASSWVLAALLGALPFQLSSLDLSVGDSIFEAMSGLTTTGSTVITGLDHAPRSILMWRALLQWMGGAGIVVTAVTILPVLRIGGMQMFRLENSDKADKIRPRLSQVAQNLLWVYGLLTLAVAVALLLAGMSPLEAVCHAMSSLSTGGFSTSDESLGHFGDLARWICVVGMILGGSTFSLFVAPWKRGRWALLRDSQMHWYLSTMLFFALLLTFWNWAVRDMGAYEALRQSTFNVVAVLSTTGYHANDYDSWGGFAEIAFFIMAFVGGCTGSAAGGIKVFRYEVLFGMVGVHIKRLLHPHGVFVIDFNGLTVSETVVRSVLGFMMLYFFSFATLAVALSMTGIDAVTGLSAAASAISNVGPGLGHLIGPGGSYKTMPETAKWLLTFGMLLGRLEIATVIILFSPTFWRE
jgi:trk system potassium uptake protein TrkH